MTQETRVQTSSLELPRVTRANSREEGLSDSPTTARRKADLRRIAQMCHKQISKDIWGKKDPNSYINCLRPQDVEAFALDIALRTFWDLLRRQDAFALCSISPECTARIREITLAVLQEHEASCTHEYSFEVPDPVVLKEREEEKQKQVEASREQMKQRSQAMQQEREARKARLEAKRQAVRMDVPSSPSEDSGTAQSNKKPSPIVQNRIKIQAPPTILTERTTPSTVDKLKDECKSSSVRTFSRPSSATDLASVRGAMMSKDKVLLRPSAKRESASASLSVSDSSGRAGKRRVLSGSFPIQAPPRDSGAGSSDAMKAFRRRSKKEKTFKMPHQDDDDAIPTVTIKQTLVDTEQLVPLVEGVITQQFSRLCEECPLRDISPGALEFVHLSVKGPRPQNEDELAVIEHLNEYVGLPKGSDQWSFFAAYDGHQGKYTSLFIRSQIHHKVCRHPQFPHNIDQAIRDSILEVDEVVNDTQEREEFACGSTVLSAWIRNRQELIISNVGDCRGFICRRGEPLELAVPHYPNREDERQRIVDSGGAVVRQGPWRVNGILAVSRSVGDYNLKKFVIPDPEITRFELEPEDEFVILASDGLWDVISPTQMIEIVRETSRTQGKKYACRALCEAALEHGTKDNVTVLLMFINRPTENVPAVLDDSQEPEVEESAE